jgi:arsenite oxidase small subunit
VSTKEPKDICKEHFPVEWEDDAFVNRREFTKALGLASFAAFVGSVTLGVMGKLRGSSGVAHPEIKVAEVKNLKVGQSVLFHYPDAESPCILVRHGEDAYSAYGQKCTHLGCPVHYNAEENQFYCPCHVGKFSVEDGTPVAGPPRRALPMIELTRKGNEIWTTGQMDV